jgi:hypothetical protein
VNTLINIIGWLMTALAVAHGLFYAGVWLTKLFKGENL